MDDYRRNGRVSERAVYDEPVAYAASVQEPDDTRAGALPRRRAKPKGVGIEILVVLVQALVIATLVRSFGFQSFTIQSGSLMPNLLVGDYVFVSKYAYGYSKYSFPFGLINFDGRIFGSEPKRGDVAVFHNVRDDGKDYIKRVIGLPGDRIKMQDAMLYINDVPVKKEPIGSFGTDKPNHVWRNVPRYRETLPNGVSYETIEVEGGRGYLSNTGDFQVPDGHLFMLGDNREDSQDSRVPSKVGFVPIETIIGRAEKTYFSLDTPVDEAGTPRSGFGALAHSSVRWDRLFRDVK